MPSVQCPRCGAKLNVPEAALGKSGRCPKCQEKFLVQLPVAVSDYDLAPIESSQARSSLPPSPTMVQSAPSVAKPAFKTKIESETAEKAKAPAWLIPAAVGGAVFLISMLALTTWIGMRLMGGGQAAGPGANNGGGAYVEASGDQGPLVVPARAGASSEGTASSIAVESADPAEWKVTVDGAAAPENLKSFIPLEDVVFAVLATPRPDVGEAAVIAKTFRPSDTASVYDWIRCDLRQEKPVEIIHLWKEGTPRDDLMRHDGSGIIPTPWSLSPSGERLASAAGGTLWVWGKDGTQLSRVKVKGADNQIPWVGFGGEETVWVRWKNELRQYAVPNGDMIRRLDDTLYAPPSFTPGGKYMLIISNKRFAILSALDGSQAGVLKFPEGFGTILPAAVNPSGTKVAVAMANRRADALFVVWDLATGKFEKAIEQTYARVQQRLIDYRLAWVGDDLLLVNHVFFHLGLGEIIGGEFRDEGVPFGPSPDGRLWQVRSIWNPQQLAQLGEQPPADMKPYNLYLTAATMPPPAMQTVIKESGGFSWRAGTKVNAVLHGVPPKHRQAVAAGCADWLAHQGFTVDPQAKIKLELTIKVEADGETTGNKIPQDQLTPAMREYLRTHQHEEWVELLKVKNLVVEGKAYDPAGKPAFKVPARLIARPIDKGGNDDPVWQALATWKDGPALPKTFFLDSNGKRVYLRSKYIIPGVDGVVDAVVEPDAPSDGKDEFELPAG